MQEKYANALNIEYKLSASGAQYGSLVGTVKKVGNKYEISTISKKTGKNVLDAFSKENRQQIEKLLLAVIPGHKIMVKKLNELGKLHHHL